MGEDHEETHADAANEEQSNELKDILSQIRNTNIGDKPGEPRHPCQPELRWQTELVGQEKLLRTYTSE
eukprot:3338841-Pyramimonas_sp.AAC.1